MTVNVRFFALARQTVGQREMGVELKEGSTVQDLWEVLIERFPKLTPMSGSLKLAVNQEYARPESLLHEGDQVAVIPPVSGG